MVVGVALRRSDHSADRDLEAGHVRTGNLGGRVGLARDDGAQQSSVFVDVLGHIGQALQEEQKIRVARLW